MKFDKQKILEEIHALDMAGAPRPFEVSVREYYEAKKLTKSTAQRRLERLVEDGKLRSRIAKVGNREVTVYWQASDEQAYMKEIGI